MKYRLEHITPYIIAGGKSERMGRDKRTMVYKGMTLLERMCLLAEAATGKKPVLVGNNLPAEYRQRFETIRDAAPNKGPLAGLVSALEHNRERWTSILPTDMPGLEAGILEKMYRLLEDNVEAVLLSRGGFIEPLAGIYFSGTAQFWRERLERGELALIGGIYRLRYKVCEFKDNPQELMNINRQEDWEENQAADSW